jgi:undecaprenyl diphosphate synthase
VYSSNLAMRVQDELHHLEDIDENYIQKELETNCTEFPYQDLLIQTSGEVRVSNFLLWIFAYSELLFNQKLCPDFGKAHFKIDRETMVDNVDSYCLFCDWNKNVHLCWGGDVCRGKN